MPPSGDAYMSVARASLGNLFDCVYDFASNATPNETPDETELLTFANVGHRFRKESLRVARDKSSSLKSTVFIYNFVLAPCLEQEKEDRLKYVQELGWDYLMIVRSQSHGSGQSKYTPHNDLSLVSVTHYCHLIIGEVILNKKESDRYRLLVQAIVAARVGRYLRKSDAKKPFILMVLYLRSNLIVERYLVSQTGEDGMVHIVQKDFDLRQRGEAVEFLKSMYNFGAGLDGLLEMLDKDKSGELPLATDIVKGLPSLTAATKAGTAFRKSSGRAKSGGGNLPSINEQTTHGIYNTDDVRAYLERWEYKIVMVLFDHPHVAAISHKYKAEHGYLKFVPSANSKEIKVLQFLGSIVSDDNHTVRPLRFWPVNGGTIVSMPVVGCHSISYAEVEANLYSIVQQLVEGVAFMHTHGVAHLDLKPQNILIDECGRLWIIDFSVSEQVESVDEMYVGFAGTKGYAAPEVGREEYSPIRADAWSCGNVIRELCELCGPSMNRNLLLRISEELMNEDPHKRPDLSEVAMQLSGLLDVRSGAKGSIGVYGFEQESCLG